MSIEFLITNIQRSKLDGSLLGVPDGSDLGLIEGIDDEKLDGSSLAFSDLTSAFVARSKN